MSQTILSTDSSGEDPLSLVGQTIDGTYRIDSLVGEGGFGVVYRSFHLKFQQPVAVKCLKIPGSLDELTRKDFLRKFQDEGRLLFQLSQGSLEIVRSIALGDTVTPTGIWTPFVVLEWLDGDSLAERLAQRKRNGLGGMTLGEVVSWLDKPAKALGYAHRMHVAHRDIKPANFFVLRQHDDQGRPIIKVLDFGIAKVVEQGMPTVGGAASQTSFSSFTPQYAAPEQFNPGLGSTGPWTDVYSFALMMVEMLCGHPAFEAENAFVLTKKALDKDHRPTPRAVGVEVSSAVESVFTTALKLDPRERQHNMDEFWRQLTSAVDSAPTKVAVNKQTVAIPSTTSQRPSFRAAEVQSPVGASVEAVRRKPSPATGVPPTPVRSAYPSSQSLPTPIQQQAWRPHGGPSQPLSGNLPTPQGDMPAFQPSPSPPQHSPNRWLIWLSFGVLIGIVTVIVFGGMMCTTCVCVSAM